MMFFFFFFYQGVLRFSLESRDVLTSLFLSQIEEVVVGEWGKSSS